MDSTAALGTIAEFSIGLAGFTGIVSVFAISRGAVRTSIEFRVRNLLLISFVPGFLSLAVIGLIHSGLEIPLCIRVGSALLGLICIVMIASSVSARKRMEPQEKRELSRFLWWFAMVLGGINVVAQLLNASIGPFFESGILILGLVATLLLSAMTFFVLVLQVLRGGAN